MKLVIIESGGANFLSIITAFKRLGVDSTLSHDPQVIKTADAVILPGVGSAGFSMQKLQQDGLASVIQTLQQPVLGICLGMQLLYEFSEEDQVCCLGIINGRVNKFTSSKDLIVPHMGWNNLTPLVNDQLVSKIDLTDVYFVHSYYVPVNNATIAQTEYGVNFTAIARQNNFYGIQFHPEKSGASGSKLLESFLNIVRNTMALQVAK